MASVKMVNRLALAAFAPEAPYLAAGTMAGAVDLSFSSTANLDIFQLDFASDDRQLVMAGSVASSERFTRISWGKHPANSEQLPIGIIAGGLVDGNIGLWNPSLLISSIANREGGEVTENAFLGHLSKHSGPVSTKVHGLEFNAFTPNLLASGADDGEICIWDISNPAEPTHFPPLKGSGSATQNEISYISWNSKVQQILASTSSNGTTVVWDLRKQKPVISFSDPIRRRCSVLQWNPDVATQLVVASDEDTSPALRMWDMRNVMSPVKELTGHTKGVVAMAWCPIDSSYLLTCAKDNRTICWDVASGEIASELPEGNNWNFDVHWYPKCPGVISASSFDGNIGIYNIEGCGRHGVGEGDFAPAFLRAPKWYKREAGVSFGFGGKLVSFHSTGAPVSVVYVQNVLTEHGLVNHSSDVVAAIQNGERSSLRLLCEKKSEESVTGDERETWGFLKVMFEDDGSARTKLLSHLGFTLPVEEKDTTQDEISEQVSTLGLGESLTGEGQTVKTESIMQPIVDDGEDFFNNLPSPKADTPLSTSGNNFVINEAEAVPCSEETPPEINGSEESADPSFEDSIQRLLVVGDYKGAVAQCISANKMADALVIAHVGGTSLWESTREQYLKTSHSSHLKVISAMVNNDLMSLVNTRPLKSWKETLALLCTFAQQDEWTLLCDTLGSRLLAIGEILPATLCYICAGNIDKTIEIWSRSLKANLDGKSYVDLLQDLMEKTVVFALATRQKYFSASVCKLVEKYAEILASQGQLTTAMEYLKFLGTEDLSPELMILRDHIARSTQSDVDTLNLTASGSSQLQTGAQQSSFGNANTSQHYYPEPPSQFTSNIPNNQYSENYQHPLGASYIGYAQPTGPTPYQPAPQQSVPYQPAPQQSVPNMFVPTPTPLVPEHNVAPPPVAPQHASASKFMPTNLPALRNVGQYQQPTLGDHLYPVSANPSFPSTPNLPGSYGADPSQVNTTIGQNMPPVIGPSQNSRGFTNPGVMRPNMSPMQPPSPAQTTAVQPHFTSAAPPPTVQTVDTSNVPAQQKPVIVTLTRLFNETSEALGGSRANPAKKREIEDNSKKLGALFAKLNSGDISKNASEKLVQLCQALNNGDFITALHIQVQLTTSDWDECNFWLATLKRMIKTRQSFR